MTEDKEYSFHYWLEGPGVAEAIWKKADLVEYLNRIKKDYLDQAMKLNSAEIKIAHLTNEVINLTEQLDSEKKINSELTEENQSYEQEIEKLKAVICNE